ncbi:MAG TPA: hypothetical protein IGS37_11040 [Synechococcales cyanobacterium M55_K2018_004]|nr:hypothetical protein [Synechococcales cyanobacterium M55_K2018_004]
MRFFLLVLMDIGDVVRLRQPFCPERERSESYQFGVVVGFAYQEEEETPTGVVVYLYNPESGSRYTDAWGDQGLFTFQFDELDLP